MYISFYGITIVIVRYLKIFRMQVNSSNNNEQNITHVINN